MIVQPIDTEALRKLADAAAPGPWHYIPGDHDPASAGIDTTAEGDSLTWDDHAGEVFTHPDAEFIAAAREAIPALLDALEQAEADRDWLFHSSRLSKKERIKANARADEAEARIVEEKRLRMEAVAAVTEAEARIEAVERLAHAADDGTEYEHNGHDPAEGEAECPGCWALGIRRALDSDA